jgi:hypothetical protein
MAIRGRKRHGVTDWESLLPEADDTGGTKGRHRNQIADDLTGMTIRELTDESVDGTVNLDDPYRAFYYAEHGAEVRTDGDDNPKQAHARPRVYLGKESDFDADKIDPTKCRTYDTVQIKQKPLDNLAGQMVSDCHGFMVDDHQSRPWKTAKRTHCAHCGGEMPTPNVSKYPCEFELPLPGCRCSGCTLRELVSRGDARSKGQPRKYCSVGCRKSADAERNRWKRAVVRAEKLGTEPPPEPEDRGVKFVQRFGHRSSIEGAGHRYTASMAGCLPIGVPRV